MSEETNTEAWISWRPKGGSGDEPRDYGALSPRQGILTVEKQKEKSAIYDGWKYLS